MPCSRWHCISFYEKRLQSYSYGCRRFLLPPKNEIRKNFRSFGFHGPSVEIRTRGLLNPIQARYQTSPHPDILFAALLATSI